MYALVLSYKLRPELKDIRLAHAFVLGNIAESLAAVLAGVGTAVHAGTSDLVLVDRPAAAPRKFSGNSMRARRSHLLYHGTLLYDFDLRLIESCLQMPPRQPDYREQRSHVEFVSNLPATRKQLVEVVDSAWPCTQEPSNWPASRVAELVATRFGNDRWNLEFG
jgi:lipoate-protein ligase A